MKTNFMKLLIILVTLIFLGAGTALAKDRHGDRNHKKSSNAYAQNKGDRHHNDGYGRLHKKHSAPRYHGRNQRSKHYVKHHKPKYYYHQHRKHYHDHRPVVHKRHRNHYHGASGYSPYSRFSFGLAVIDPNMAFSIGVNGR